MKGGVRVMHCVRNWGAPSQTFLRDTIERLTVPSAVLRFRHLQAWEVDVPVWSLDERALQGRAIITKPLRRRARARAARRLRDFGTTVAHVHFGYELDVYARAVAAQRLPWMLSLHGQDLLVDLPARRRVRLARRSDLVLVPSRWLRDRAEEAGIRPDRIVEWTPGLILERFPFRPRSGFVDAPVIAGVGRFVEKKGFDTLIDAMADVAEEWPGARLVLAGTGPLAEDLRARAAHARVDVSFVAGDDRKAVLETFERASVIATPSRTATDGDTETLCYVNLEAQALGIPLVTTNSGGIPSGIDPSAVEVVRAGDARELGEGIRRALRHGADGRRLEAARHFIEQRFDVRSNVPRLESYYEMLVGR